MDLLLDNQDISEELRRQKTTAEIEQENGSDQEEQDEETTEEELKEEEELEEEKEENRGEDKEGDTEKDEEDMSEKLNQLKKIASAVSGGKIDGESVGDVAAGQVTKELLKQSWVHLIDSFGLTLIYINIHAYFGFVEGNKMFCKLGEEFNAPPVLRPVVGMLELMAIFILDFIIFLILLFFIGFMVMLISAIVNPIENAKLIWDLFKDLIDLSDVL